MATTTELKKCSWCLGKFPEYEKYHDEEWGVPVHDDKKHFEFLVLEGAQAGLSWSTVLKKRNGYRDAFANFDPSLVAGYDEKQFEILLNNDKIIRNKQKIASAINNARRFIHVQEEFGSFDKYIWSFVSNKPIINSWKNIKDIPATTKVSDDLSTDLKKRGFKFVGSTVIYAHLQACGLVNDHIVDCFRYSQVTKT